MKITPEMVEAALVAYLKIIPDRNLSAFDRMRAALVAALAVQSTPDSDVK